MDRPVEDLVAQARTDRSAASSSAAFAELIRRFEPVALAMAYARVPNPADASDVVQEAFMRAWERLDTLDDPARFGHWLGRMVRNLAIDQRRRKAHLSFEEGFDPPDADVVGQAMEADEQGRQIDRALQTLDELSRECIILRYYQDLSSKEIAELLDLSPAAVDMRISRARNHLKERLTRLMPPD